jgi:hypothetical protein
MGITDNGDVLPLNTFFGLSLPMLVFDHCSSSLTQSDADSPHYIYPSQSAPTAARYPPASS